MCIQKKNDKHIFKLSLETIFSDTNAQVQMQIGLRQVNTENVSWLDSIVTPESSPTALLNRLFVYL